MSARDAAGRFAPRPTDVHDYSRYAHGCRCETCKAAKAAYVRTCRAAAAELRKAITAAGSTFVVEDISHGLGGYQNRGCRCRVCCRAAKANRENSRRRVAQRAAMAVAS